MSKPSRRHFEVHELLGQGAFGVVYRATLQGSGGLRVDTAVKLLKDASPEALDRLEREGRILARLSHPAILQVKDLVRLGGRIALVTEYVAGMDLAEAFEAGPPLPPRALVEAVGMVAEGLHAAWVPASAETSQPTSLVHRDIKPSNIRIGVHGEVKLLDFGVAWSAAQQSTRGDSFVGSVPYMAPERMLGEKAQPAADIYALGCTLYEGLTRARLHPGEAFVETVARLNALARSPSRHDRHVDEMLADLEVPAELVQLLRGMLAHDQGARPTAGEVARRCDQVAGSVTGERLKHWCLARTWSGAPAGAGPLTGQTLYEDGASETMSAFAESDFDSAGSRETIPLGVQTVDLEDDAGAPARRPPRWAAWFGAVALLVALALVGGLLRPWEVAEDAEPPLAPVEVEAEQPPGVPPPEPVEVPIEDAGDGTEPVVPVEGGGGLGLEEEGPAPVLPPAPEPAGMVPVSGPDPAPLPDPAGAEPPPPPGHVVFVGEYQDLKLVGSDGSHHGAGDVPPDGYKVLGKYAYADDWSPFHDLAVVAGQEVRLKCNNVKGECVELD